jgi:hypothetical protein
MKPTPQPSTSKRLGVINLVLCQASFLQSRHTNKGMKLMLTKEEASREREREKRRWTKKRKHVQSLRKEKEKTRRRLNLEVLLRTWPSLVQTQPNFLCVSTAFLRLFFFSWKCWFFYIGLFQEKDVVLWIGPGVSPVPICLTFEALRKKKGPADVLWMSSPLLLNARASALQYDRRSTIFRVFDRNKFVYLQFCFWYMGGNLGLSF